MQGSRDGELALNLSIAAIDQFKVQQDSFLPDQGLGSREPGDAGRPKPDHGPGINNRDLGLEKFFPLRRDSSVRPLLRAEAFNAWNHTQFRQPNADAGAGPNFGRISAARAPRLIQVGGN